MKTKLFIFMIVALLLGCDDNDTPIDAECVQVKLVRELCGQAILEIVDPAYFHKGQAWVDGSGQQFNNVFSTLIPCDFHDALSPGDVFIIQFSVELSGDSCARCYALLDGPEKFNYITTCLPICGAGNSISYSLPSSK